MDDTDFAPCPHLPERRYAGNLGPTCADCGAIIWTIVASCVACRDGLIPAGENGALVHVEECECTVERNP